MTQADIDKGSVIVAWLSPGKVHHWFDESLHRTRDDGVWNGARINCVSGPRIAEARSTIFDSFLSMDDVPEWIWLVDTDMSFPGETLRRLLEVADRDETPMVGGLCYAGGHTTMFPTLYELVDLPDVGPVPRLLTDEVKIKEALEVQGPVKVAATGGACLLVHRTVVQSMKRPYPNGYGTLPDGNVNPYPWFVEGQHIEGNAIGEDVAFTWRAFLMGHNLVVHTGVEIDHWKERPLNTQLYQSTARDI
jgi:hypothetical protein